MRKSRLLKLRKNVPWAGWSKIAPTTHQRSVMLRKCGSKCFLGSKKRFPICAKNTCSPNYKGIYAAYVRAKEMSSPKHKKVRGTSRSQYAMIAAKAKLLLNKSKSKKRKRRQKCRSRKCK
jgi:hypothetical protein